MKSPSKSTKSSFSTSRKRKTAEDEESIGSKSFKLDDLTALEPKDKTKLLKLLQKQDKQQKAQKKKVELERQSVAFKSFFVAAKVEEPKTWGWSNKIFMPFQIKEKMTIAPLIRREPLASKIYENLLSINVEKSDYLENVRKLKRKHVAKDPMRAKYFHFQENFRSPYYGTWRKVSKIITGRRPFAISHDELNYDVDSDAEWEEEKADEVEDLSSDEAYISNDESDETDEEFLVEHGYFSGNEGSEADDLDRVEDLEERQRRMGQRANEFKQKTIKRRRKPKKDLTPQIYGLKWQPPQNLTQELKTHLIKAVVFNFSSPNVQTATQ